MYLAFTCMPAESYCRRLRSLSKNHTYQKRISLSFSADVTLVNLMYLAFPRMAGEDDLRPIRSLLLCPLFGFYVA